MPTTIMTPEEVMRLGRRIILFPKPGMKGREIYFVEGGRLTKQTLIWVDGQRHECTDQSIDIRAIYPYIEMVYSKKKKGILLAKRGGNRESNKRSPLPLKKTGKCNGEMLQKAQIDIKEHARVIQQVVKKRQKKRYYQEQHG